MQESWERVGVGIGGGAGAGITIGGVTTSQERRAPVSQEGAAVGMTRVGSVHSGACGAPNFLVPHGKIPSRTAPRGGAGHKVD